jgi:hypothetical protein
MFRCTRGGNCGGTAIDKRGMNSKEHYSLKLFKTTIVIWSEYDPSELDLELSELARQAENGDAYCASMTCAPIPEPEKDPAWDGTDFFDVEGDEDGDPCASPDEPRKDKESTG